MNDRLTVATLLVLALPLAAQRAHAKIEHQERSSEIDYGTPPWGRHSLDELPVGESWRLGSNEATSWRTELPLLLGRMVVAPGSYRLALDRHGEEEFRILLDAARQAVGQQASAALRMAHGTGAETEKLEIELAAQEVDGQEARAGEPNRPARLEVRFGPHRLTAELELVGGEQIAASPRYRLVGWSLPVEALERELKQGAGVPVATFFPTKKPRRQDPELFNVVVTEDGAEIVPGMTMPTEAFGFGDVEAPAAEWRAAGKIEWLDVGQNGHTLRIAEATFDKRERTFSLELHAGARGAVITVPEPRQAKR